MACVLLHSIVCILFSAILLYVILHNNWYQTRHENVSKTAPERHMRTSRLLEWYPIASEGLGAWFLALFCSVYSPVWRHVFEIFGVIFPMVFQVPIDSGKIAKNAPKRVPTGLPNGAQIGLLAARPKASWICYLSHLSHMGLPWPTPKWIPKCSPNIEAGPGAFFG